MSAKGLSRWTSALTGSGRRLSAWNTAGVLARVKRGEAIDITERGSVIARLVPAQGGPITELLSSGKLTPATVPAPMPRPGGLVRREPESDALVDWIDERAGSPLVSSALAEVELPRALRRAEPVLLAQVPAVLGRLARYEIDEMVRAAAAGYSDPALPSLDAIHLATASAVFADLLTAFVTYDRRLLDAATALGLPIASPA